MTNFVDRDGNPIDREVYVELFLDQRYRILAKTTVHKRWVIMTSWVGIDQSSRGRPLYFETIAILIEDPTRIEVLAKYPTKQAAVTGHRYLIKQVRGGKLIPFRVSK